MKIKNEYVKIEIDGKTHNFCNLILDEYLKLIASKQCTGEEETIPPLTKCYIKLDTKLDFSEDSELTANDFDYQFTGGVKVVDGYTNKIVVDYIYNESTPASLLSENIQTLEEIPSVDVNTESFSNRQITAIGFFTPDHSKCCACISTYGLGLKFGTSIKIYRRDIIKTDAKFSSDINIPCPAHLMPTALSWHGYTIKAYLERVGLGTKSIIYQTYALSDLNRTCEDNKVIIHDILENERVRNILEPGHRHPSSSMYPTSRGHAYNYIYFRYRMDIDDLGTKYYYLSMPIEFYGQFDYVISYERSE